MGGLGVVPLLELQAVVAARRGALWRGPSRGCSMDMRTCAELGCLERMVAIESERGWRVVI